MATEPNALPSRDAKHTADVPQQQPSKHARMDECDYDRTPTLLYKTIEKRDWDELVRLFEAAEEESDDEDEDDDMPSPENGGKPRSVVQEASVWVVRKEKDGRLRWRLLPLHAALIFDAPLKVVDALIRVFPLGATLKDDQGMLPLHLACRNTPPNFEVMEELLTAHPAAVYVKDRKGRTPILGGLAATGREKNPGLSVMELYTQIAAAGEKQRWRTEQEQQISQKLRLMHEEQQKHLSTVREEYEAKLASLNERHAAETGALTAQLKAVRVELEQKTTDYDALQEKQKEQTDGMQSAMVTPTEQNGGFGHHFNDPSASNRMVKRLQTKNRQLLSLVQGLLDQQSSLRDSLRAMQADQEKLQTQRNALMRQYNQVSDEALVASQSRAALWQEELDTTEKHIREALRAMSSSSTLVKPETSSSAPTLVLMKDKNNKDSSPSEVSTAAVAGVAASETPGNDSVSSSPKVPEDTAASTPAVESNKTQTQEEKVQPTLIEEDGADVNKVATDSADTATPAEVSHEEEEENEAEEASTKEEAEEEEEADAMSVATPFLRVEKKRLHVREVEAEEFELSVDIDALRRTPTDESALESPSFGGFDPKYDMDEKKEDDLISRSRSRAEDESVVPSTPEVILSPDGAEVLP